MILSVNHQEVIHQRIQREVVAVVMLQEKIREKND